MERDRQLAYLGNMMQVKHRDKYKSFSHKKHLIFRPLWDFIRREMEKLKGWQFSAMADKVSVATIHY
jgi:hypothetical protein